jgi:hypothetical protein
MGLFEAFKLSTLILFDNPTSSRAHRDHVGRIMWMPVSVGGNNGRFSRGNKRTESAHLYLELVKCKQRSL